MYVIPPLPLVVPPNGAVEPPTQNPQPLLDHADHLTIDNVGRYKRSECRYYVRCVDVAVRENWPQFTCNACLAFEPIEVDSDEQKALERLARLLARNG